MPIFSAAAKHDAAVSSGLGHDGPASLPTMFAANESSQPPPVSVFLMRVVSGHSRIPA
jgi:hypothetical protein